MNQSRESTQFDFWKILKGVSRSFYLSLYLLPFNTRKTVALAYALARAADTLADTTGISIKDRVKFLKIFRRMLRENYSNSSFQSFQVNQIILFVQSSSSQSLSGILEKEKILLVHLKNYLQLFFSLPVLDKKYVYQVLNVILKGMELDLVRFGGASKEKLAFLNRRSDLDEYCYLVAGVVGEFWTNIHTAYLPHLKKVFSQNMMNNAISFGKALQMTNILRDIPSDLKAGRCYLPLEDLKKGNIRSEDLFTPSSNPNLAKLIRELLEVTLKHYQKGIWYVMAIPTSCRGLRFSCILPLLIGIKTLKILYHTPNLALEKPEKISRKEVYQLMFQTFYSFSSPSLTKDLFQKTLSRSGFSKF